MSVHEIVAEESICRSLVVSGAHRTEVPRVVGPSSSARQDVIEIEVANLGTPPFRTDERALHSIDEEHLIPYLLRNGPPARR